MHGTIFGKSSPQAHRYEQFCIASLDGLKPLDDVWFDRAVTQPEHTPHLLMAAENICLLQLTQAVSSGGREFVPPGRTRTRIAR